MEPETGLQNQSFADSTSSTSWVKSLLSFSVVLLICHFAYQSYVYVSDKSLLAECNGDKRLFRKIKRGSIYNRVDLEGARMPLRTSKSWANDADEEDGGVY